MASLKPRDHLCCPLPVLRWLAVIMMMVALRGSCSAEPVEIAFDRPGLELTTVIGLYTPEGSATYLLGTKFSLESPAFLESSTVRLHVHVGNRIRAVEPEEEPRLAVRINGGAWHWQSLKPFQDDKRHWIDIAVPVGEWVEGLNLVEVTSNVSNPANQTPESLDLIGFGGAPLTGRSVFSRDGGLTHNIITDRNWGMRLVLEKQADAEGVAARLEVSAERTDAALFEPVQYVTRAYGEDGKPVSAEGLEWSAQGGAVDRWGLFRPARTGQTNVTAKLGDLTAELAGSAHLAIPVGVEPPDSPRRLEFEAPEGEVSLNGMWDFRLDPMNVGVGEEWFAPGMNQDWSDIAVPGCWQAQGYGLDYHGTGWYRRTLEAPPEWAGKNLWITFHAAATHATVWLNGQKLGEHLGNWAPFTFSLAEHWNAGGKNVLVVRVEELPAHFSAGFPREIGRMAGTDSHFGGLWQDVTLDATGPYRISDLYVHPRLAEKQARARVTLESVGAAEAPSQVECVLLDPKGKEVARQVQAATAAEVEFLFDIPDPAVWSQETPHLYTAMATVSTLGEASDFEKRRFGMRSVERRGTQILLNGEPLMVRGILHWGYYPDLITMTPSEDRIRKEFEDLRASGFNLVKVCLFFFPRRFYEIADETGMLLWQEYPTWLYVNFPQAGDTRLDADFAREYPEWFRFDRSYPSIILRDLTCEAHINPNFDLLERTYKVGKEMLDGALLCDNSSFFQHRITDWYVCHTYRDLDEYYAYLAELIDRMRSQEDEKPFLFGEDFDADTYRDMVAIQQAHLKNGTPWWLKNENFSGQVRFENELRQTHGADAPARFVEKQLLHAMALRKAYMEEFRRYPEPAGFVMTSLRDITVTRPGFYDDQGQMKWTPEEWESVNADRALGLFMEPRSRCFSATEDIRGQLYLSNFGGSVELVPARWRLKFGDDILAEGTAPVSANKGVIVTVAELDLKIPETYAQTDKPLACVLEAEVGEVGEMVSNRWPVWIFPAGDNAAMAKGAKILVYSPNSGEELAKALSLSDAVVVPTPTADRLAAPGVVLVTDTVDDSVREVASAGASVLYLAPKGDSGFLPRRETPFWRETAIWVPSAPILGDFPHEGFVDLQFLDLTSRSAFQRRAEFKDATAWIWGTHARNPGGGVYDYLVEEKLGEGRILACALNVAGEKNVAGHHLLRCLIEYGSRNGAESSGDRAGY